MFFLKQLPTRRMLEGYRERFPLMNVDAVEDALHLMRRASLLLREIEAYFAEHGLSQMRFLVLVVLDREPERDGLRGSELAERIDVSRPVMTRTLQALERESLIQIEGHAGDGRVKLVKLTKRGRQQLHRVLPGYYAVIETFMAREESHAD